MIFIYYLYIFIIYKFIYYKFCYICLININYYKLYHICVLKKERFIDLSRNNGIVEDF